MTGDLTADRKVGGEVDTEKMRDVGQKMAQTHAYMGSPPVGSTVWIGGQLLEAADEIDRLRAIIANPTHEARELAGKVDAHVAAVMNDVIADNDRLRSTIAALLAIPDDSVNMLGPNYVRELNARMAAVAGGES